VKSPVNFNGEDFFDLERKTRFDAVRSDIAARLRRVCSDLPEDEFELLVDKMAWVQVRREGLSR